MGLSPWLHGRDGKSLNSRLFWNRLGLTQTRREDAFFGPPLSFPYFPLAVSPSKAIWLLLQNLKWPGDSLTPNSLWWRTLWCLLSLVSFVPFLWNLAFKWIRSNLLPNNDFLCRKHQSCGTYVFPFHYVLCVLGLGLIMAGNLLICLISYFSSLWFSCLSSKNGFNWRVWMNSV